MRTMWETATPLLDCDAVGFYRRMDDDDELSLQVFYVQWNRGHTGRYAQLITPGSWRDRSDGERYHKLRLHYDADISRDALRNLSTADRFPTASALRFFAAHGPFERCMFCNRPLEEDLVRGLGLGVHCARKRLGVGRRFLQVVWSRTTPPPNGGQPVRPPKRQAAEAPQRHLQLVAVNGRRVA